MSRNTFESLRYVCVPCLRSVEFTSFHLLRDTLKKRFCEECKHKLFLKVAGGCAGLVKDYLTFEEAHA